MKNNKLDTSIPSLREDLRQQAMSLSAKLSRSVGRLTSCDSLPCLEYGEEIAYQRSLANRLFFLQNCRNALERCIPGGTVVLRHRWPDGSTSRITFRKLGPNRVRVTGLTQALDKAA